MLLVARVLVAPFILMLVVSGCAGGGGGGSAAAGTQSATPAVIATSAAATSVTAATTGSIALSVVDYFTGAPIAGATVTIDAASTPLNDGAGEFSPASGLHALAVAATGYATYNGGLQMPGGATARTIALFPVSPLMTAWLARINADRAANGRGSVALDDMLTIAAYDHAVDMGARGYFAHFDTHGFAPTTRSLLLGSMMMGAENIAAGYSSWSAAEDAFMAEKALLPNASASDCAANPGTATGHFCNIVWADHNWVGVAAASVAGSPLGTYYDQEFGDLYGRYDTSLVEPATSVASTIDLSLAPAGGATVQSEAIATLPAPAAIATSVLNADPECSTQCPAQDVWYPAQPAYVNAIGPVALALDASQLYFVAQYTSTVSYVGAGSWALAWPNASAAPDRYASAAAEITTQSIERRDESAGRVAAAPRREKPRKP